MKILFPCFYADKLHSLQGAVSEGQYTVYQQSGGQRDFWRDPPQSSSLVVYFMTYLICFGFLLGWEPPFCMAHLYTVHLVNYDFCISLKYYCKISLCCGQACWCRWWPYVKFVVTAVILEKNRYDQLDIRIEYNSDRLQDFLLVLWIFPLFDVSLAENIEWNSLIINEMAAASR